MTQQRSHDTAAGALLSPAQQDPAQLSLLLKDKQYLHGRNVLQERPYRLEQWCHRAAFCPRTAWTISKYSLHPLVCVLKSIWVTWGMGCSSLSQLSLCHCQPYRQLARP